MRKEDNEVLKYNHGEKSVEVSFIIYADLESLHEKMSTCYKKNHQQLKKNTFGICIIHTLLS